MDLPRLVEKWAPSEAAEHFNALTFPDGLSDDGVERWPGAWSAAE